MTVVRVRTRLQSVVFWTRRGLLIALCVYSLPGQPAFAAEVRGQIVIASLPPRAASKAARPLFNWELENGVKEVLPERTPPRELAVVLLGPAAPSGDNRIEVSISGGSLLPSTLVVRTDTTLRIRNDDEIGHELAAVGLDGFSAEATSPGATRSVHLTKPGSWPLRDMLAVHAGAYLHVVPNLSAVAKLEPNGSYVFPDVPAGKYTLKVFRGADALISKDIEVTDRPLTVDPLTFTGK
jgi:hypothetical protein